MLSDWYRSVRLPISLDQFHQLPRNPAYKYEYLETYALLTPRPKTYNALLDLKPLPAPASLAILREPVSFRLLREADWAEFAPLFAGAFQRVAPFAGLSDDERLAASRGCLDQTRGGGDGPLIPSACLVADSGRRVVGAILVTLIPRRPEGEWWDGKWPEPLPEEAWAQGRPHLTWVFVSPWFGGGGVATALLGHAVNALLGLGYSELATTFLLGNESSALWHWRNGFRLLPYPGSFRTKGIERS